MIQFGTAVTVISSFWAAFKVVQQRKKQPIQYDDDGTVYSICFFDGAVLAYACTIWKGEVPWAIVSAGYTQAQNDVDKTDFETIYKPTSNQRTDYLTVTYRDPYMLRRFGNLTALAVTEVLLAARAYVEQSAQAQRSVVSTSVQDKASGTGSVKVRITYLNSAYELKTEDVTLNGTTAVNTVATDIRFIEKFQVIQGAAAVGAIKLMTAAAGGGTEFCGIGIGTYDAFLCHHYVPAGKSGYVYAWQACVDDETKFKLMGRANYDGNVVDEHWDLHNLMGITTPPGHLEFMKYLNAVPFSEKAYIRVTVVPNQATSTTIRGDLLIWEQ
jgi:hypothetical protein